MRKKRKKKKESKRGKKEKEKEKKRGRERRKSSPLLSPFSLFPFFLPPPSLAPAALFWGEFSLGNAGKKVFFWAVIIPGSFFPFQNGQKIEHFRLGNANPC